MSPSTTLRTSPSVSPQPNGSAIAPWPLLVAWACLAGLVLINLPAFLCMGLDSDVSMYDLLARRVMLGEVHYRDLLETNFPGIVWLHMLIRAVIGWRSEALRAVDLLIVASSAGLLVSWIPRPSPSWRRVALLGALLAFYLSTSEWSHCQRDVWMLLPALLALRLRARQADRLRNHEGTFGELAVWAFGEGMVWASACWIKPFVFVPAAVCWLLAARQSWGGQSHWRLAGEFAALAAGGLVVGGAGVGWLVATGAWPAFVEVMFDWNREYFAFNVLGEQPWGPVIAFLVRSFPWVLVHLAAVPLAVAAIRRPADRGLSPLFAGFYLAWLAQAILLQHLFDYVHVPPILLGMSVLTAAASRREPGHTVTLLDRLRSYRLAPAFILVCLSWSYPALLAQRAAVWLQCVTEGSTAAVRDRVTLLRRLNWSDLERTANFLRDQGVGDGQVTSFNLPTVALYGDLALAPSTRYVLLQDHYDIFATRRSLILAAVVESRQKFLVCDLSRYNMQRVRDAVEGMNENARRPRSDSQDVGRASGQIAFRAGNYVVYRLAGSEMPAWLDEHFTRQVQ